LEDSYTGIPTQLNLNGTTNVDITIDGNAASFAADRFRIVFKPITVLPVTFTTISARKQNATPAGQQAGIAVQWKVDNELDIVAYDVQRAADGRLFSNVKNTPATGNNPAGTITYNWLDTHPVAGDNYYRIRSIARNGSVMYSQIVKVNMNQGVAGINLYPNPVSGRVIALQFMNMDAGIYSVRLINSAGQEVFSEKITHGGGSATQTIQLNNTFMSGVYQLEVTKPEDNFSSNISLHIIN
jgi:hypothetical protein